MIHSKRFFSLLILLLLPFLVEAQIINGILQSESGEPVPYAHIVIGNSTIGTISNDSGYFSLKIASNQSAINISAIGFKLKNLPFTTLENDKLNVITLENSKISMDEVVVKGSFDSAGWYVQQAINRIKKNYPRKKHSQIAFYRESTIRDTTYARMVDAIVLVSEKGVNRKSEDTQYEILRKRQTKDNRDISWGQSLSQWLYQDLGPYTVNKSNPIKPKGLKNSDFNEFLLCNAITDARREYPTRLFFDGFVEDCVFEITNTYRDGSKEFVEISIKPLKEGILDRKLYVVGKMIIAKDDFAVIQFERVQYGVSSIFLKSTLHDSTRAHYLIKWKKNTTDKKYYVNYIRDASIGSNGSRILGIANIKEMFESEGKSGFIKQVNEWYVIENREYEKIDWRNQAAHDDDIYEVEPTKRLNVTFDVINVMPVNPINQKMLDDLSQNKTDDALFIEE